MTTTFSVYISGGPHYPDEISGVPRERAEQFAISRSADDTEGRTWVVERDNDWQTCAEYRGGKLRLNRPHDSRAARLAKAA